VFLALPYSLNEDGQTLRIDLIYQKKIDLVIEYSNIASKLEEEKLLIRKHF
jgi:hypothetical protein